MLITLRYDKGLGNSFLSVRARNSLGQFWNFSTQAWDSIQTINSLIALNEFPDDSTTESTYITSLPNIPSGSFIGEIINDVAEVVGIESAPLDVNALAAVITSQLNLNSTTNLQGVRVGKGETEMNFPAEININIVRGAKFTQDIIFRDKTKLPFNFYGYQGKGQVRASNGTLLLELTVESKDFTDALAKTGTITISASDTQTKQIPQGFDAGNWDLMLAISSEGIPTLAAKGYAKIEKGNTDWNSDIPATPETTNQFVTSDYTIQPSDSNVAIDASNNNITISLGPIGINPSRVSIGFMRMDNTPSDYSVTIEPADGEDIMGSTAVKLTNNEAITLVPFGTRWFRKS